MQRRQGPWRAFGPMDSPDPRARRMSCASAVAATHQAGFRYINKLTAHTSCVNALAWSSKGGRWLASAGDDRRVLLWDMHQEDISMPSVGFCGPESNVFELAFSASNKYLFSGGTDELVLTFNLDGFERLQSPPTSASATANSDRLPNARFREHMGSIRGIAPHPNNDEIYLTAAEDGIIFRHDMRDNAVSVPIRHRTSGREFTGVQFHPVMDQLFVASAGRDKCALYDARMAFSPDAMGTRGMVHQYATTATKSSGDVVQPEASSITFDHDGSKLAITFLKYYPTIFSMNDPYPLAVCTGKNLPSGTPVPESERTYRNACTIKHGSFGGPRYPYFAAGSDDFRGYCWNIPDVPTLVGQRELLSNSNWDKKDPETIGFTKKQADSVCVPVQLDSPAFRLGGHNSIVNTVLIHPALPYIATAGVERRVVLHSPHRASPSFEEVDPNHVRELPTESLTSRHSMLLALMAGGRLSSSIDPDVATIELFDEILREDSTAELFPLRRRGVRRLNDSDDSSSSSSSDEISYRMVCDDDDDDDDEENDSSEVEYVSH